MVTSPRRIDRASLRIPASPQRIYAAFIDASALAKWLPPKGARGIIDAFEPHPGGAFRMTLVFEATTATGGKSTSNRDSARDHEQGMASSLANLAEHVARSATA